MLRFLRYTLLLFLNLHKIVKLHIFMGYGMPCPVFAYEEYEAYEVY